MVGTIGIDDIIVPSEAAAENASEAASDNRGEESVTDATRQSVPAADATEATRPLTSGEDADAPEPKTNADPAAAETAEPQDGGQMSDLSNALIADIDHAARSRKLSMFGHVSRFDGQMIEWRISC